MTSYLTDTQLQNLSLTGTPDEIAARLADANAVYAHLSQHPWCDANSLSLWAEGQWGTDTATPTTPDRLNAAVALLAASGRITSIPT
jgi:hypothetical protein